VVFQQIALDLDLSIRRNLLFQADLHGLPRRVARARIEAGCARLGLDAISTARCASCRAATAARWNSCAPAAPTRRCC
jgi:ABC-type multidrug transport system ATPase subunit